MSRDGLEALVSALSGIGVTVINTSDQTNSTTLVVYCKIGKMPIKQWESVVLALLTTEQNSDRLTDRVEVSRVYARHPADPEVLAYRWRIVVCSDHLSSFLGELAGSLDHSHKGHATEGDIAIPGGGRLPERLARRVKDATL